MQLAAKEIAEILSGTLEGNGDVLVTRPGKIEEGGAGIITFLASPRYEIFAYTIKAAVLLVNKDFQPAHPVAAEAIIRVKDVYDSLRRLMEIFGNNHSLVSGISDKAVIHPDATLGQSVNVGVFSVIEEKAVIGSNTIIHSQVYIGKSVIIGENCIIHPGVKIHNDCVIGNNCIIHSNTVIGSDGFGFVPQPDGSFLKLPQIGNVVIEDDVEIGANVTIDRATMGSTIIRKGAKLDNLIMVAHNVEIGRHTVIAAQTGIAGSTKIGNFCRIGGQAGFVGHIRVADGTQIQAQSGVAANIEKENSAWYGSPALPYRDYLRAYAIFKKLPTLSRIIENMEKKLKEIEKGMNQTRS